MNYQSKVEISHNLADFNWEDQAHGVLYKYAPEVAEALTAQSEYAFEMTNDHYGGNQVDSTYPMRNAIVKYLMHIHGIRDTYFNYCNMNKVMHQ